MTGLEIALTATLALFFGVLLWQSLRLADLKRERDTLENQKNHHAAALSSAHVAHADLHFRAVDALPDQMRYEIQLADWGPDFTGEGDTLPRWRWVIVDADHDLKQVFETPPHTDAEPLMLGNENTALLAMFSALEFIDKDKHPSVSVVVL